LAKFEIDIPLGRIEAETYSEFLSKVLVERDFWSGVGSFDLATFGRQQVVKHSRAHIQSVNEMIGAWNSIVSILEDMDGRQFGEEFTGFVDRLRQAEPLPPSSSSDLARAVNAHLEEGRERSAVAILVGYQFSTGSIKEQPMSNQIELGAYQGFVDASFSSAMVAAHLGRSRRLKELDKDFAVVQRASVESSATQERLRELETALENEINLKRDEVTQELRSIHERILKSFRTASRISRSSENNRAEEFQALINAFNLHMRLKRPVLLWEDREKEHAKNSEDAWTKFRVASFFLAVSAILIAFAFGDYIAQTFVPQGCVNGDELVCGSIAPKGPLTISMILLIATVWLWYLRLQMKVHLSERHLALDARERRAFAETYLSLLKGNHVSGEHEAVVLQSLFRPTQDGIIKDDGGLDIGVAGLLSKALDRRT